MTLPLQNNKLTITNEEINALPLGAFEGNVIVVSEEKKIIHAFDEIKEHEINAGDDVFMVGRFVDNDGSETNQPSLRFGNISILNAKVTHPLGYTGNSIVLDMRSRSGYSGSPVFVYRTHGSIFAKDQSIITGGHLMKLLGIHWWQYPEKWKVEGNVVTSPSGMTAIYPTTAIWKVLNIPELLMQRQQLESSGSV